MKKNLKRIWILSAMVTLFSCANGGAGRPIIEEAAPRPGPQSITSETTQLQGEFATESVEPTLAQKQKKHLQALIPALLTSD